MAACFSLSNVVRHFCGREPGTVVIASLTQDALDPYRKIAGFTVFARTIERPPTAGPT